MQRLPLALKAVTLAAAVLTSAAHAAPSYQFKVWTPGVRALLTENPTHPQPGGVATGLLEPLSSADFGTVLVGQTETRNFRFTNVGNAQALDVRAAVGNGDIALASTSCGSTEAPVTVAPGASCDVSLIYALSAVLPLQGTLAIGGAFSNFPAALALSGMGKAEAIGVLDAATSVDFGAVALGASTARTFTFKNTGNLAATNVAAAIPKATG